MISDAHLLELNSQGLIPGPDETEETFLSRAEYCLNLREKMSEKLQESPLSVFDKPSSVEEYLAPALQLTERLYQFAPAWIPLFFSNYKLAPWHGGCAWIFQTEEGTETAAFLQLRKAFAQKKSYLKIYARDELIAHELCHVGRMCFEEPRFEEILA